MSDNSDEDAVIDWIDVVKQLRRGHTIEIPCPKERDYERRTAKLVKRAEKKGIGIEVQRGEGVLRVEPRPAGSITVPGQTEGEGTESPGESPERQEKREARRVERQAERDSDD